MEMAVGLRTSTDGCPQLRWIVGQIKTDYAANTKVRVANVRVGDIDEIPRVLRVCDFEDQLGVDVIVKVEGRVRIVSCGITEFDCRRAPGFDHVEGGSQQGRLVL